MYITFGCTKNYDPYCIKIQNVWGKFWTKIRKNSTNLCDHCCSVDVITIYSSFLNCPYLEDRAFLLHKFPLAPDQHASAFSVTLPPSLPVASTNHQQQTLGEWWSNTKEGRAYKRIYLYYAMVSLFSVYFLGESLFVDKQWLGSHNLLMKKDWSLFFKRKLIYFRFWQGCRYFSRESLYDSWK